MTEVSGGGVVLAVTPEGEALVPGIEPVAGLLVLVVDCHSTAGGWVELVEDPSRSLINALAAAARDRAPSVAVVLRAGAASTFGTALAEAVHGTVDAAALELGPHGTRVNTVVIGAATPPDDLAATLAYLGDEPRSGSTTGTTIDLAAHNPASAEPDVRRPVLVTGAGGGLGRAAVEAFLATGRSVVATDLGGPALALLAEELDVPTVPCDVTEPASVADLAEHDLIRDGVSALVVHHGVGGAGALVDLSDRVRDRSLRVNGTGVWNIVEGLLPALRRCQGTVVALSSQAGIGAEADHTAYCAAKFAVVGMVRALARAIPADEVRIHALCPGPVDTPLMREAFAGLGAAVGISAQEYLDRRLAAIPLGHVGTSEEIGAAAVYLASLRSTGVVLAATGGAVLT